MVSKLRENVLRSDATPKEVVVLTAYLLAVLVVGMRVEVGSPRLRVCSVLV